MSKLRIKLILSVLLSFIILHIVSVEQANAFKWGDEGWILEKGEVKLTLNPGESVYIPEIHHFIVEGPHKDTWKSIATGEEYEEEDGVSEYANWDGEISGYLAVTIKNTSDKPILLMGYLGDYQVKKTNLTSSTLDSYVSNRELLALSDLVYVDLGEYVKPEGRFQTLKQLYSKPNQQLTKRITEKSSNLSKIVTMDEWQVIEYAEELPLVTIPPELVEKLLKKGIKLRVNLSEDWQVGLNAAAFKNKHTNEVVIAFRGSQEEIDWYFDIMGQFVQEGSFQFNPARKFVNEIVKMNSNSKIILTGHSLGGYLAQKMSLDIMEEHRALSQNINFVKGVTFNANGFFPPSKTIEGVRDYITSEQFLKAKNGYYNNFVTNYGIGGDPVFTIGGSHIGGMEYFDYNPKFRFKSHAIANFYEFVPDLSLNGKVTNEQSKAIPGASVTIKYGNNVLKKVKADKSGYYSVNNLKKDLINLTVDVQADGYEEKKHVIKHVLSKSVTVDINLTKNWINK